VCAIDLSGHKRALTPE
jgi:WD40 repeat protein